EPSGIQLYLSARPNRRRISQRRPTTARSRPLPPGRGALVVPIGRFSPPGPPPTFGAGVLFVGLDPALVTTRWSSATRRRRDDRQARVCSGWTRQPQNRDVAGLTKEEATKIATELGPWVGSLPLSIRTFVSGTNEVAGPGFTRRGRASSADVSARLRGLH